MSAVQSTTRSRGIRPWAALTPAQRDAAELAYVDLLDAVCEARRGGWHVQYERDVLAARARALGVSVWPALADRVAREARITTAAP